MLLLGYACRSHILNSLYYTSSLVDILDIDFSLTLWVCPPIQLASCRSLCFLIGDCNVSEEGFNELLPTCWSACFKLMEDVQEFDSKVRLSDFHLSFLGDTNKYRFDCHMSRQHQCLGFLPKLFMCSFLLGDSSH